MSLTKKPSCPSGYILRNSYKTKSGNISQARCIRKTGILPGKSSNKAEKLLHLSEMSAEAALKMSLKRKINIHTRCTRYQTLRNGYNRKSYTRKSGVVVPKVLIPPNCIKKRGKSRQINGKRVVRIILDPEDHYLSEYGYHNVEEKSKEERHQSLHKLINNFIPIKGQMATYNYVIKALNARYVLDRNTNPKVARIFKADQKVISAEYKKIKN